MPRHMFRDWRPDLPEILNPGVLKALNTRPLAGGFGPTQRFLVDPEVAAALPSTCLGGWSARDSSRKNHSFAGTSSSLHHIYAVGLVDVSRPTGYAVSSDGRWEFSTFGNFVFATNYSDDLQYFDMRSSTLFDDVANVPDLRSPYVPRARHIGTVKQFLIVGNYYDSLDGSVPNGVAWPAIGNPLYWPQPGSEDASATQSDRQALEGDGGWVQRIISGVEVGAIFQEKAIQRVDYRGGSEIFEITKVEEGFGLQVPGLAAGFGRGILFYSEAGWRLFDYTSSLPAGKSRIDTWFKADFDSAYPHRCRAFADPDDTLVVISYPGAGHTNGNPNKLLLYDYALDRFTHGDEALDCLAPYLPALSGTMDNPVVPMDTSPFAMDDIGGSSGDRALGGWNTAHRVGDFSGDVRDVTLETGKLEHIPGRRSRVVGVRPLVTGDQRTELQIAPYETLSNPDRFRRPTPPTRSGRVPARVAGRYHKYRLNMSGGDFEDAIGLDIEAVDAGSR